MIFLVLDPGVNTGFAVYNRRNKELLDSGCIRVSKAPPDTNKLTYLEEELRKLLKQYQPVKVYKEKKAEFVRGRRNVHAVMVHGTMHDIIEKVVSEWGVPLIDLNTRRWARKKVAQARARETTGKKHNTHTAECICWGMLICQLKGL